MSEEDKIKQFEKEQLNKLLIELKDIDNFKGFEDGAFKYSLGKYQADLLLEHINQLQKEHNILTEFEKWLEELLNEIKNTSADDIYQQTQKDCLLSLIGDILDKLQELKGSDK